jgi:hypothetical protein
VGAPRRLDQVARPRPRSGALDGVVGTHAPFAIVPLTLVVLLAFSLSIR